MSRILAIEDDAGIGAVLRRGLALAGHEVSVAPDGTAGRRAWNTGKWDLVLLDVMLPDADGLEILAEQRARGDSTPVVLLTAREEVDLGGSSLAAGATDHLRKPFAYEDLLAHVDRHARRAG
ncbi:MAG TPA: response regulator [Candidatus Limnocylindria bacterium]|nr:response regulator [Candidatus Limnocylindria bacterium]